MKSIQRVLALLGIIGIAIFIIATLIYSIFGNDPVIFKGLLLTLLTLPVFVYVIMLFYRFFFGNRSNMESNENSAPSASNSKETKQIDDDQNNTD